MRKIACIIAAALVSMAAFAQQKADGKVTYEDGEPVLCATVALLERADSSVVAGTVTDENGNFSLEAATDGCILMVSMIGYRTAYLAPGSQMQIRLEPSSEFIDEAVVSVVMPKTKLTAEGLQTSVRGSVLESIGSANDVLARTPGLIKGRNGLEVIGKGSPLVYVNGRKLTDASELDRIPSNEIQSVEVITNPGAQYDATVRAVVRIRTVRRQGEGFSLNLNASDEQSLRRDANDPNLNLNMNYRMKDVDIFAGTNLFTWSTRQTSDLVAVSTLTPKYGQEGHLTNDYFQKSANVNGGVNWQPAANHSLGFRVEYGRTLKMEQEELLTEDVLREDVLIDVISAHGIYSNGDRDPYTVAANAYYNGLFGGKFGVDLNLDYYGAYNSQQSLTEETSEMAQGAEISTTSATDSRMYAGKLVLSYPIWRGQLQFGTEQTYSERNDSYLLKGAEGIPPSESDVTELNSAAFASYGVMLPGRFGQLNAGLRYEHVEYEYLDQYSDDIARSYDNFFPSLAYANVFGPVQFMLNYSSKTKRPDFSMLSDAIRYNSRYVLQSGNASLQPQVTHDINLAAVWKFLTFSVDYNRTNDPIMTWGWAYNNEGVGIVKPVNLDSPFRMLTAFANVTPTIGIWSLNATAGIQQQWLRVNASDPSEATGTREISFSDRPMFFMQLFNTLRLKYGWQLELGAEVHSTGYVQNNFLYHPYLDLNAAVQKAFLKDGSLIVRLQGSNLAGLANTDIRVDFGEYKMRQTNVMDTQRVKLSLIYRFNAAQSKYRGTGAGKETASRMKN